MRDRCSTAPRRACKVPRIKCEEARLGDRGATSRSVRDAGRERFNLRTRTSRCRPRCRKLEVSWPNMMHSQLMWTALVPASPAEYDCMVRGRRHVTTRVVSQRPQRDRYPALRPAAVV
ncbi:uncharacterized protein LAESUDRAFT_212623 [Laetiporus sulphureus 93-53]|uniref:Uncharacterized protein n=1 Tax=Laetiporus sulphureus 93-53 TaxID=1314785 RepID=A0A165DVS6_9APHY|nr:uncharacterized protein LAESUDRAFT_212623 [Laetiporus sulphureus 93-53]KZT05729.1 hypothetical protein LAESUDRAFT_212623 [Laetiporus sulphureus 93-53]